MIPDTVFLGNMPYRHDSHAIKGGLVDVGGERYYRIANYDRMAPFLMSLVGDSDLWLFISSNGALTAGRRDRDHALFPYYTDDRIHDSQDVTGSKTLMLVERPGGRSLWEPFSRQQNGLYRIARRLYKSVHGNGILFEEINEDLALAFVYGWRLSARFGFVRRATLTNLGMAPAKVELLDGVQNLMPPGISYRFQLEMSTLADGYKLSELEPVSGLGLIHLSSTPTDRAEPSEALSATTVWSLGLEQTTRLLSSAQLDCFREGCAVTEETRVRGQRGAYFVNTRLSLSPEERKDWYLLADVDQRRERRSRDLAPHRFVHA